MDFHLHPPPFIPDYTTQPGNGRNREFGKRRRMKEASRVKGRNGQEFGEAPLLLRGHLKFRREKMSKRRPLINRKFFLVAAMIGALLIMPMAAYAQREEQNGSFPPIAQALVREGDFAVPLVPALQLGEVQDEAEAEGILLNAGIEPRNG
jgi:hypothetical protein